MKSIEFINVSPSGKMFRFGVRQVGITRGCGSVWQCHETGITIRSDGFPDYLRDRKFLLVCGRESSMDRRTTVATYEDFADICKTVAIFNKEHAGPDHGNLDSLQGGDGKAIAVELLKKALEALERESGCGSDNGTGQDLDSTKIRGWWG